MRTIGTIEMGSQAMAQPEVGESKVRQLLLICGILASLLYALTDVLGALHYPGYSFTAQAISELAAIDAPSRPFTAPLFILYDVFLIAFIIGAWQAAKSNRMLRVSLLLLVAMMLAGLGWGVFPMHMRGVEKTISDTMHAWTAAVVVPTILLSIGFAAKAFPGWFRSYSITTIVILLASGLATGTYVQRMDANLPTPGLGVAERINVYGYLLWVAMLALVLLRTQHKADIINAGPRHSES